MLPWMQGMTISRGLLAIKAPLWCVPVLHRNLSQTEFNLFIQGTCVAISKIFLNDLRKVIWIPTCNGHQTCHWINLNVKNMRTCVFDFLTMNNKIKQIADFPAVSIVPRCPVCWLCGSAISINRSDYSTSLSFRTSVCSNSFHTSRLSHISCYITPSTLPVSMILKPGA